jgi:hypothetical protein
MTKERGPLDYLDDWKLDKQSGDSRKNASGADNDGGDYSGNVPMQWDANEVHPEARAQEGGYGHGSEVKETKGASWDMDKDEIARGYSSPKVKPTKEAWQQDIPAKNEWDRGAAYAREHPDTGEHTAAGNDKPSPGKEAMGSRENQG